MIWAGCFEKLLKVIHRLPCLEFKITLDSGMSSSSELPASLSLSPLSQLAATMSHWGCHFGPILSLLESLFTPLSAALAGAP
jgi:hypothetical protein